ncbi:MAG: hypothetical protein CVV27_07525 [Candidatus Melainabacteria bacterium HGW-Melainabacteria-1]|nr:MAG: hypothetical protein CVV27_07525 [Candidatus Melainabacteria bacterium HGW-Melainabacteria-1]
MRVPPNPPAKGTGQLPFEVEAQLQLPAIPRLDPQLDLRLNQRSAIDNTRIQQPRFDQFDQTRLQPSLPKARTEIAFVAGHAPVTLELTQDQTHQLQALIQRFPELKGEFERLATEPAAAPRLLAKDRHGESLLSQLHRLGSGSSRLKGVDPAQALRELVPRLNERQQIFQGPQFTCGSAAMQNWLQHSEPGELARITADLVLDGKSKLRDGSQLKLPPDLDTYLAQRPGFRFNHGKDSDTRSLCDTLFQSAVMQDISLVGGNRAWKGDADLLSKTLGWLTDWAGYDAEGDDLGLGSRLKGDGGGDPILLARLMEAVSGRDVGVTSQLLNGRQGLHRELAQAHAEGREMIALYKSPLHYVLVQDFDPIKGTVTCLSTGTYSSSVETFSLKDFLNNCAALINE